MKKTIIFISFTLLMGVSLSSVAAYAYVHARSQNGNGSWDIDINTFTLPANSSASYELYGSASIVGSTTPHAAACFNCSLTSDIGNVYIGDYADIDEGKYTGYGYTSGSLYSYYYAHSVTIQTRAFSYGFPTDATATVDVSW